MEPFFFCIGDQAEEEHDVRQKVSQLRERWRLQRSQPMPDRQRLCRLHDTLPDNSARSHHRLVSHARDSPFGRVHSPLPKSASEKQGRTAASQNCRGGRSDRGSSAQMKNGALLLRKCEMRRGLSPNRRKFKNRRFHPKKLSSRKKTIITDTDGVYTNMASGAQKSYYTFMRSIFTKPGLETVTNVFSYEGVARISHRFGMFFLIKGVQSPDVVNLIKDHCTSCNGVIVSSHGGRYGLGAVGPFTMLPRIRLRANDVLDNPENFVIGLDSGVRSATEVAKCLMMGADIVGIGRPFAWSLTLNGPAGVAMMYGVMGKNLQTLPY